LIAVEELGGISNDFVVFNPERVGGKPDYKMQTTDTVLLKFEGESELVSLLDYDDEFIIINSKGEVIADSTHTNPDFVEHIVNDIFATGGNNQQIARSNLN
jgi:hypothetical protein